ncbi:hypothetical protein F183_A42580 [Bryobacterales bacterium F-183]|nr:hypothetical protein F183_A42580 [Bryobacterales bacterium F-183]
MLLLGVMLGAAVASAANTYYLAVAGLGGEPEYEQRFAGWASDIEKILKASQGVDVQVLKGADATKAKMQAAAANIAKKAAAEDQVVFLLIGHGTYDGTEYKFNVTGPDVSGVELASMLDRIAAKKQLLVNMTSASGGALASLQKPGRTVITATKAGTEKNATVFARYWVEAMRDVSSDTDKNEVISALEAFKFAESKTEGFYKTQNRLATEHPVLEDTGKGTAVKDPSPANGQGLAAAQFALLRLGAAQAVTRDPAKRELFAKKEQIEQQIDKLKYDKAAIPATEYRTRLSQLLLELAKVQEALDQ